MIKKIAPLWRC